MKRKLLVIVGLIAVIVVAGVVWWRGWAQYDVVATVQSIQPPICTQNIEDSHCGDGVIVVRTAEGTEKEYHYSPKTLVEPSNGQSTVLSSLREGMEIRLTISHGDGEVTRIRILE